MAVSLFPRSTHASGRAPLPRRVGLRLVAALAGAVAVAVPAGFATVSVIDDDTAAVAVVIAEVYTCVAGALLLAFGRTSADRQRVLGLVAPLPGAVRRGAAAWIGAYVAAAGLYAAASIFGFSPADVVDVLMGVGADGGRLADASVPVTLLILLRVCLLVPVAEELLFRGALFGWLRLRLSATWTIAITGVLFGLMHQMPAFIPLAVVVGVVAGWIREKTGSTVVPVVLHAVQNIVVVVASLAFTGWTATLPMA